MGKYIPDPTFPSLKAFEPDDTDECFYIKEGATMNEIIDFANKKWGLMGFKDIKLTPEHIHTWALGYDRYDPSDYDNFLKIERITDA